MIKKIQKYFKENSTGMVFPSTPPPRPPNSKLDKDNSLKEAWRIINVLHMELMDKREAWPRALQWLADHEEYR